MPAESGISTSYQIGIPLDKTDRAGGTNAYLRDSTHLTRPADRRARAADGPFFRGLSRTPEWFPIAVWLQAPTNAERSRAIGINTYVGLWKEPTVEQLDALDKAGIRLICEQNERSLRYKDRPTIVGWMHGDEPDIAQSLGSGKEYGPPISPAVIVESYEKIRKADPERPVLLNLGQGVAWNGYIGRGVRTNHPEDRHLAFDNERFHSAAFLDRPRHDELLVHDRTPSQHPGETARI